MEDKIKKFVREEEKKEEAQKKEDAKKEKKEKVQIVDKLLKLKLNT